MPESSRLLRLSSRNNAASCPRNGCFVNRMNNIPRSNEITQCEPVMVSFNNTFDNIPSSGSITVNYTTWDSALPVESKSFTYSTPTYITASSLLTDLNANCVTTRSANASSVFSQDSSDYTFYLTVTNVPSVLDSVSKVEILLTGDLVKILGFTSKTVFVASSITVTTVVNMQVPNFAPTDILYVQMDHLANNSLTELGSETTKNILCAIPMGKYARGTNVHWEPSCGGQYLHKYPRPLHLDQSVKVTLLDDNFQQIDPPDGTHIDVVVKTARNLLRF